MVGLDSMVESLGSYRYGDPPTSFSIAPCVRNNPDHFLPGLEYGLTLFVCV